MNSLSKWQIQMLPRFWWQVEALMQAGIGGLILMPMTQAMHHPINPSTWCVLKANGCKWCSFKIGWFPHATLGWGEQPLNPRAPDFQRSRNEPCGRILRNMPRFSKGVTAEMGSQAMSSRLSSNLATGISTWLSSPVVLKLIEAQHQNRFRSPWVKRAILNRRVEGSFAKHTDMTDMTDTCPKQNLRD